MNSILNKIIEERKGHYCHVVEVSSVYELESICENIFSEYEEEETIETIIEFLETLTVYFLNDEELSEEENETNEEEVYNFVFSNFINSNLV